MAKPAPCYDKWITGYKTEPLDKFYDLGKTIGQPGQFGTAYLVKMKGGSKEVRAVKVVSKNKFKHKDEVAYHYQQLRGEIQIMQKLKHNNIIQLYEVYETAAKLYIVMECCKGGELFDRIQNQPSGSFSEKDAQGILHQIISGIEYMHKNKIAHCDLKPDNFLFMSNEKESNLKIIDFGMSKYAKIGSYMSTFRGTAYYVAPEVLARKYQKSCDIWSFGVVMFVMLFGYPPFHGETDPKIFEQIKRGFNPVVKKGYGAWFPAAMPASAEAKDLIKQCLNQDDVARISATEVLSHPFFTQNASNTPLDSMMKNLKDFSAKTKFKNQILLRLATKFDKDDVQKLQDQFKSIDINNDGSLSEEEMVDAFKGKMTQDEVKKFFQNADIDGDGTVTMKELIAAALHQKFLAKEERLYAAFCSIDKDLSGEIDADELMKHLGVKEEEAKQMIAEVDLNKDGKVSYDEFAKMWMTQKVD